MPLDPAAVGARTEPLIRTWDDRDTLLYALGVGCGIGDPAFTTENTSGVAQRVLPTFGVLVCSDPALFGVVGTFDLRTLVHGSQSVRVLRPMPGAGALSVTGTVASIVDKGVGKHAVLTLRYDGSDPDTGEPVVQSETVLVLRGAGGFGGNPGQPSAAVSTPDRTPDAVVHTPTRDDQALLYRLSGDRNRLHSDAGFAQQAGFPSPILHGLCTYGMVGRALLQELCDDDPARFGTLSARFSAPVFPGETLTTHLWHTDNGAKFTTTVNDRTVLTNGHFTPA